jgi:hypothetical protein
MKPIRWLALLFLAFAAACSGNDDDGNGGGDDDVTDDDADDAGDDAGDDTGDDEPPALSLSAVDPPRGGASVGAVVTLTGSGFAEGLAVFVGDDPAAGVTVVSPTEARATFLPVPATACGARTVSVTLADRRTSLPDAFEYTFDEDPIVFVHGWTFSDWEWETMIARFSGLGYPADYLAAIAFADPFGSNVSQARDELAPFVDDVLARTGAQRVDIVAHSMGGLSTRLWIKFHGGAEKVRDYVSLAGTHHGTAWSCAFTWSGEGAEETCPAYADQEESVNGVQWDLNGDPDLPDVDETPFGVEDGGGIAWHAIWTDADLIDVPAMTSCLNQNGRNDCSDPINVAVHGVGHIELALDEGVFWLTHDRLRAHNAGKP